MVEPRASLTTGDRVYTPQGVGVVVYRRMRPPEFSAVACYSVKLDGREHAGAIFAAELVHAEPPRPPEPCDPTCPGWAVYWTGGADEHLYPDDTIEQARARRSILACDACWFGVSDAPGDEVYQQHPACLAELEREVSKALAEVGHG